MAARSMRTGDRARAGSDEESGAGRRAKRGRQEDSEPSEGSGGSGAESAGEEAERGEKAGEAEAGLPRGAWPEPNVVWHGVKICEWVREQELRAAVEEAFEGATLRRVGPRLFELHLSARKRANTVYMELAGVLARSRPRGIRDRALWVLPRPERRKRQQVADEAGPRKQRQQARPRQAAAEPESAGPEESLEAEAAWDADEARAHATLRGSLAAQLERLEASHRAARQLGAEAGRAVVALIEGPEGRLGEALRGFGHFARSAVARERTAEAEWSGAERRALSLHARFAQQLGMAQLEHASILDEMAQGFGAGEPPQSRVVAAQSDCADRDRAGDCELQSMLITLQCVGLTAAHRSQAALRIMRAMQSYAARHGAAQTWLPALLGALRRRGAPSPFKPPTPLAAQAAAAALPADSEAAARPAQMAAAPESAALPVAHA